MFHSSLGISEGESSTAFTNAQYWKGRNQQGPAKGLREAGLSGPVPPRDLKQGLETPPGPGKWPSTAIPNMRNWVVSYVLVVYLRYSLKYHSPFKFLVANAKCQPTLLFPEKHIRKFSLYTHNHPRYVYHAGAYCVCCMYEYIINECMQILSTS